MVDKLKNINDILIDRYKNDNDKLNRQLIIKNVLKEINCFNKMKIDTAYSILGDLELDGDMIDKIYLELI